MLIIRVRLDFAHLKIYKVVSDLLYFDENANHFLLGWKFHPIVL